MEKHGRISHLTFATREGPELAFSNLSGFRITSTSVLAEQSPLLAKELLQSSTRPDDGYMYLANDNLVII